MMRPEGPTTTLHLGVAADQLDASPQTPASLQQTLESPPHVRTLGGHTDSVHGVAFAPDGRTPATTSNDPTVRLWDLNDRDQPRPLGTPLTSNTDTVWGVAFAPDVPSVATTATSSRQPSGVRAR
ncbi:MAG: WD40 repeat domain-containing protein [Pseudonocardiaceae bacterium]